LSYDIFVFRGSDRGEPETVPQGEWEEFLAGEGLGEVDGVSITTPSGQVISFRGPFVEWGGHSSGVVVQLAVWDGPMIVARNADDETIRWLIGLAARFGGRAQGEADEVYDESWRGSSSRPPLGSPPPSVNLPRGHWWTGREKRGR
jgi:hypothetical protein